MKILFRAKEKNTDNYIIGYEYYNHIEDEYYITHYITGNNYKVDKSTRSINFDDMLDSNGNKIFASLHPKGKGGDILDCRIAINCEEPTRLLPIKYTEPYRFTIGRFDIDAYHKKLIVGIQQ